MEIIQGRKSGLDCVVELYNESYRTKLSLEKSLTIANHSPDGFQWGYSGSGPAPLAAAILYEITDDVELSRANYELFKHDHVWLMPMKMSLRFTRQNWNDSSPNFCRKIGVLFAKAEQNVTIFCF